MNRWETAASDRALEVSVSFGRFENDSLSWEKWSSFSQNKYMEEVEKCATPGSVAKKKAYFEAHYKKIAARKAEQLGQEKQMEHDLLGSNDQNGGDPIGKACGTDPESHIPNGQSQTSAEGTGQETKLDSLLGSGHVGEVDEDAAINVEGQGSLIERVEELGIRLDGPTLDKPEEVALVKEDETLYAASQEIKDSPEKLDKETQRIPVIKEENVKLDHWKEYQKDKDIVKRAFKTFQNNFSQLKASAEERSLGAKQVPAKGTEVKVSNSMTPRKENAGKKSGD
ncbi:hypothetical protein GH714_027230 [Hevea brasiliensis]|uniref:TPX2 C-terminal domain-containing protein n=1 Tax=Hevea brasiliensis TaxID=3981 RepID=A0A6A6NJJ0_HEVBR|nr:hypothetical protein GH714_027230 [Hevea brasiliensis]